MKSSTTKYLAAGLVLFVAGVSYAKVTTVALYRCGEDGDVPTSSLVASVGTDASVVYNSGASSIQPVVAGAPCSLKCLESYRMAWSPGFAYLQGRANNWGMSTWVKMPPGPLNGSTYVGDAYWMLSNGNFNTVALGLAYVNPTTTKWSIGHALVETVDPALWDTWAHVALVYNGNSRAQLYVNGVQVGADMPYNAAFRSDNYGYFYIGTWNYNNNIGRAARGFDEIHVFSFEAGEFDIMDVYCTAPESTAIRLIVR